MNSWKYAHVADFCQVCSMWSCPEDISREWWVQAVSGVAVKVLQVEENWVCFTHLCPQGHTWDLYCHREDCRLEGTPLAKKPEPLVTVTLSERDVIPGEDKRGVVYIARCGDRYKIGYTKGLAAARIRSLQTGNPETITLVGAIQAPPAKEGELHAQFYAKRIRGEWFALTPEDIEITLGGGR